MTDKFNNSLNFRGAPEWEHERRADRQSSFDSITTSNLGGTSRIKRRREPLDVSPVIVIFNVALFFVAFAVTRIVIHAFGA